MKKVKEATNLYKLSCVVHYVLLYLNEAGMSRLNASLYVISV